MKPISVALRQEREGVGRKSIGVIAVEVRGRGMGRIRMSVIPEVSANSLHGFISNSVEKGSEVRSDGWSGYKGLEKKGYSHDAVNINGTVPAGKENPPSFQRERVPNRELFIYALGNIGGGLGWSINMLINPIFNIELKVSLIWLGVVVGASRLFDSLTDLLIGCWSDRIVTRWGRRRPLIFSGCLMTGLLYALVWVMPREMSQTACLVWFAVVVVLFSIGAALMGTGYWALGVELTSSYNERTRVAAWRACAQIVPGLMSPWFLWFVHNRSLFADPITGVRCLGIIAGTIIICTTMPVSIFCKERLAEFQAKKKEHISFSRAFTIMLHNKEFLRMTFVSMLLLSMSTLFDQLGVYINLCVRRG